jgi:hypothetical protein
MNNNWNRPQPVNVPSSYKNVPFSEKQAVGSVVKSDYVKDMRAFLQSPMGSMGGNTYAPGNDRNNVYVRIVKENGKRQNGMYLYDVVIVNKNNNKTMGGKSRKARRTRRHRK